MLLGQREKPSREPSVLLWDRQKRRSLEAWQTLRVPKDSQGRRQQPSPREPGLAHQGMKQGHSGCIVGLSRTCSLWKQQLIPFHPPSRPSAVFQAFRRGGLLKPELLCPLHPSPLQPASHGSLMLGQDPVAWPHQTPVPALSPGRPPCTAERWACRTHSLSPSLNSKPDPTVQAQARKGRRRESTNCPTTC